MRRPLSYLECVNTGLDVVGDGVGLEQSVVRNGAQRVVLTQELLFQLQGLLESGLLRWRLGAGIEQRGVGCICCSQTSLFHLKDTATITHSITEVTDWVTRKVCKLEG